MRRVLTAAMMSMALAGSLMSAAQAQGNNCCPGACAQRGASFVVGTAVGTFPAIIRSMGTNFINFTNDLTGKEASTGWKVAVQPLIFVPAIVNGLFEGPIHAMHNAWVYSASKPFSAEAFSLAPGE